MTHSRDVGPVFETRGSVAAGRNVIAAIGIDRYRHCAQLSNAVRDARGTVELFQRLGFEQLTEPLFDEAATGDTIQSLVADDLMTLDSDDSLVLFFAGHGMTRDRRVGGESVKIGCLLGYDASPLQDKVSGWIDLEIWLHAVSLLPARHILVVLDACHSGIALDPLLKWRASGPAPQEPLPELHARRSRRVITSAMHGQQARDSGPVRGHSLFTGCMIEGLTRGISSAHGVTTGSALGLYVQQRVQTYPHSRQTPDFGAFGLDDRGEILIPLLNRQSATAIDTISLSSPDVRERGRSAGDSGVYIGWAAPETVDDDPQRRRAQAAGAPASPMITPLPSAALGAVHGGSAAPSSPSDGVRSASPGGGAPASSGGQRSSAAKRNALVAVAGLLVVVGGIVAGASLFGGGPVTPSLPRPGPGTDSSDQRAAAMAPHHKIVVGVNDFGGAYAGLVANDGAAGGPNSLFRKAGLDVEIRWISGSKDRREAFDAGRVDVMLLTLDYLANLAPEYHLKNQDVKAFLMVDWSRGNLGIIATPEIRSIEELKDAKIATTIRTPTHYLLLTLLEMSSLSAEQVAGVKKHIEPADKTPQTGPPFVRNERQAVALWEPYLSRTLAHGKGHLLISTATATHLVADVLFARASFLTAREADMTKFVRAWLEGVALLEADSERWVPMLAAAMNQTPETVRDLTRKTKPATFVDNREFFGLEKARAPYFDLFDNASRLWLNEGVIKTAADARATRWMKPLEALLAEHAGESAPSEFRFTGCPSTTATATPLLTRNVSIHFGTDQFALDSTAEQALDDLSKILDRFGNACIRVVGRTDGTGTAAHNRWLSGKRADAAAQYLARRFDPARFQPVGAGAEEPAGGSAASRRTDFQIIANDCAGAGCQSSPPVSPATTQ